MSRHPQRIVAAVLLVCVVAASCGNSTDDATTTAPPDGDAPSSEAGGEDTRDEFVERPGVPGVTDDEIAYDVVATKTGNPLGTCILDCYAEGVEAYFAYRNSEGGIYGRDLVVNEILDDELVQNQQKALDIISSEQAFGVFQASLVASGWGDLDQAGIPTYAWGIHSTEAANRPHIYPSIAVPCANCLRPGVPYIARESGATAAASIGYGVSENSKVCADTVAKSFEEYQDDSGVELVYANDDLDFGLPNGIGPEVTAMKDAGVDFISTCIDLNGMKTLAQELQRQDMDDVVLYHPNSYDQGFINESAELFEGDIVNVQFRPFELDPGSSSLPEFQEWMSEQGSELSELAMVGWINASLAFDGLLAAGPEFDRETVTAATNAMTEYTADGLINPTDWSTARTPYTAADPERATQFCGAYVQVEDGEFVALSAADTPWLCWDPTDPSQFEPTPTDFE